MLSVENVKAAAVVNVEEGLKGSNQRLPTRVMTPMMSNYLPELDGTPKLNAKDTAYSSGINRGITVGKRTGTSGYLAENIIIVTIPDPTYLCSPEKEAKANIILQPFDASYRLRGVQDKS